MEPTTFLSPLASSSMMGIGTLDSSGVSVPNLRSLVFVFPSVATPDVPSCPSSGEIFVLFFFFHTRKRITTVLTMATMMMTSRMGMAATAGDSPGCDFRPTGVSTGRAELDAGAGVLVGRGGGVGVGEGEGEGDGMMGGGRRPIANSVR